MSSTLQELIDQAESNYKSLQMFQRFELILLGCEDLASLLDVLLKHACGHFNISEASLCLFDPEKGLRETLQRSGGYKGKVLFTPRQVDISRLFSAAPGAVIDVSLGEPIWSREAKLFSSEVRSRALLPLYRSGVLVGCYNIGSRDPDRFRSDKATDFIAHLGAVIAVCLENSVNRSRLHYLSVFDPLTEVKNRRGIERDLVAEITRASRAIQDLSLCFIDADHFKLINDRHGHGAGDRALKLLAKTVQKELRGSDHLGRFGGEEFVAILPRCPLEDAERLAEKVRLSLQDQAIYDDDDALFTVTASIGVASWLPQGSDAVNAKMVASSLLRAADKAVYQAKSEGRNCVRSAPVLDH